MGGRAFSARKGDAGVLFQCRLFLLVQALIYGVLAGLSVVFSGFWIVCLVVYGGLFPVILELIIAGCGILVGRNAGTDLHRVL